MLYGIALKNTLYWHLAFNYHNVKILRVLKQNSLYFVLSHRLTFLHIAQ
jgi:hypothetical protein